jgi:hypothetical protein
MTTNKKLILSVIIVLPIVALASSIFFQVYFSITHTHLGWIGWIEDILITIAAFLFRYGFAPRDKISESLKKSDITTELYENSKTQLKPNRFLDIIPYAMLVGTIASVAIQYEFVIGMGIYFIMQILLIIAYSGIIHLNAKVLFSKSLRWWTFGIFGGWIAYLAVVFPLLILPGLEGLMIYLVLLYVLSLIGMCIVTYLQLPYQTRSLGMRIALSVGATSFVFSDTLIGYTVFINDTHPISVLIHPTWILAIVLISTAILFQKRKWNSN